MLILKLYLFLGRFIPYFRKKCKEIIMESFDIELNSHFHALNHCIIDRIENIRVIGNGATKKITIKYKITYQGIEFYLTISYDINEKKVNPYVRGEFIINDSITAFINRLNEINKESLGNLFSKYISSINK